MQQLTFPIDIPDLQMDSFQQTQPAGIDEGETYPIPLAVDAGQDTPDFCHTQNHRQLFLLRRTQKLEGFPLPTQRTFIEELDPAQSQGAGGPGSMLFILEK